MASTSTVHKSIVRGTTGIFEAIFVEDDGTPIIPIDLSIYPAVQIVSPDEVTIQTGIATNMGDGRWKFVWLVPADAQLSTRERHWRVDWTVLTVGNRQIQFNQSFDIIDHVEASPNERAYTQVVLEGQTERLLIKFRNRQDQIQLSLRGGAETITFDPVSEIHEVEQDGFYTYYADTDALSYGCFLATWRALETPISQWQTYIQQVRVPESIFWILQPNLRMFIDKIQKKDGHVQAYSDSDLYGYMQAGADVINQTDPISSWSLINFPTAYGFLTYLVAASAWWGLQAQYISEGELAFNFSGQTVTLDVDRTGTYEAAIGRLHDYLTTEMAKTKRNMLRRTSTGVLATRPYDFGLSSLVCRVQVINGGANQILPLMSRLGLL